MDDDGRKPITCPMCNHNMVSMNKFEIKTVFKRLIKGFYAWYVCPRREGETGCGYIAVLEVSSKTKRPEKIVNPAAIMGPVSGKRRKK